MLEKEIILESNSPKIGKHRTFHEFAWIRPESIDYIMIVEYVLHGYLRIC